MRVLVTGTDGYIGSIMTPYLIEHGHDVTGLDTGFYRTAGCSTTAAPACRRSPGTSARRRPRRSRGLRRGRAHGGTVQRSARRARSRDHLRDQPHGLGGSPKRQGRRRQAVRLHLLVQRLRRRLERRTSTEESTPSTRRPRTRNARCWSSGTCRSSPTTLSRPPSCATRPPSAPRRGCASTSSSTISPASPGRRSRSR